MIQKSAKPSLREYWQIAQRRKWFILAPFMLSVLLGLYYALSRQAVYESYSTVMIREGRFTSRDLERMMPGTDAIKNAETVRKQILSRDYLVKLINTLGLKKDEKIIQAAIEISREHPELTLDEIEETLLVEKLREKVITIRLQGYDVIRIAARSNNPDLAYSIAKTLTQILIDESLRNELLSVRSAIEFSSEQLAVYKKKLEESEERFVRYRQSLPKQQTEALTFGEGSYLDQINSVIASNEVALSKRIDDFNSLSSRLENLGLNVQLHYSTQLNFLQAQLLERGVQLARLIPRHSWKDPEVLELGQRLSQINEKIRAEVERIVNSQVKVSDPVLIDLVVERELAAIEVKFLENKKKSLTSLLDMYYRESSNRNPSQEITLARLEQEVRLNREIYNMFLQQSQGSQIEEALKRTEAQFRFTVLEPAQKPLLPTSSGKRKILALAMFLGSGLGVGVAYLLEYLDQSFKTVEDVENYLGAPVLGTIPKIGFLKEKKTKKRGKETQFPPSVAHAIPRHTSLSGGGKTGQASTPTRVGPR